MRRVIAAAVTAFLIALHGIPALASDDLNTAGTGIMLHGYDPVAYFTEGGPKKGNALHAAQHHGVIYYFASAANQIAFLAAPEKYVPAYGGFCSYGVRVGKKFDSDPTAWRIVDGRLFVQLDHGTRDLWMMDEPINIEVADLIWPQIRSEPTRN